MLVLTMKPDQSTDIFINDNICLKLLEVRGNTIRLGIEAPRNVKVLRRAIKERIEQGEEPRIRHD